MRRLELRGVELRGVELQRVELHRVGLRPVELRRAMNQWFKSCLAVAPLLLAGCAARPLPPWEAPPVKAPAVQPVQLAAPSLAAFVQKMRSMTSDELTTEYQRLMLDGSAQARLQQALVLAAPGYAQRDEQRAQQQLDDLARTDGTPAAVRDSAALASLWLEDTRRHDAERRKLTTKAREDEGRITALETRLRDLERRSAEAEKKLEALRAIERELSSRSNVGRPQ
jgi:hypothetical protein